MTGRNQVLVGLMVGSLMLSTAVTSSAARADVSNEDIWTIFGGVVGGAIGSRFGGGDGKTLATAVGAAVGAIWGNEYGRSMDRRDQARMIRAQAEAWEGETIGRDYEWLGNGARGSVRVIRRGGYWRQEPSTQCQYVVQRVQFYQVDYWGRPIGYQQWQSREGWMCFTQANWRWVETQEVIFETPRRAPLPPVYDPPVRGAPPVVREAPAPMPPRGPIRVVNPIDVDRLVGQLAWQREHEKVSSVRAWGMTLQQNGIVVSQKALSQIIGQFRSSSQAVDAVMVLLSQQRLVVLRYEDTAWIWQIGVFTERDAEIVGARLARLPRY